MMLRAAAQVMQRLYESARMSYPRSASEALSDATVTHLADLAPRFGGRAEPEGTIERFDADSSEPHEALHPTLQVMRTINPALPEWALAPEDVALLRLTRHLVRCRAPIEVETPDTTDLPAWAKGLHWTRPAPGTPAMMLEAEESHPGFGMVMYEPDEIALRALAQAGLGRPSSIVEHAIHAAERGVVDARGITAKGRTLLAGAPEELTDIDTSAAIERHLEALYREDVAARVPAMLPEPMDDVLRALEPVMTLRPRLLAALRHATEPPSAPAEEQRPLAVDADDSGRAAALAMEALEEEVEDEAVAAIKLPPLPMHTDRIAQPEDRPWPQPTL